MSARLDEALASVVERVGALAVRRFGAGRPLLLVHGGVGSWSHWVANVQTLARSFEVIAVDLPGFGDAPGPSVTEPESYIDAVAEDFLGCVGNGRTFALAGFSFGAVISVAVARRLKPVISGLSILGPGGFGMPVGRTLEMVPVPDRGGDPEGHRRAVAHNLGQSMLSRAASPEDPVVDLHCANIARVRFDSRKISLQERLLDDLSAVSCPLQVIWGAEDRLAFPSITARARQVVEVRPDAEIRIIPNAGHWVQYEASGAVNALLADFHYRASR